MRESIGWELHRIARLHINFHFQIFISSFADLHSNTCNHRRITPPRPKIINFLPSERCAVENDQNRIDHAKPDPHHYIPVLAVQSERRRDRVSVRRQVGAPASINPKGNFRGWIPWGSGGTRVYVCFSLSWEACLSYEEGGSKGSRWRRAREPRRAHANQP